MLLITTVLVYFQQTSVYSDCVLSTEQLNSFYLVTLNRKYSSTNHKNLITRDADKPVSEKKPTGLNFQFLPAPDLHIYFKAFKSALCLE